MIEVSKEAGERKMDIGFIGLGKMGLNMALNVHEQGWPIIGFDVTKEARAAAREQGLSVVDSLPELLKALNKRKMIFLSTPAGQITNQLVAELVEQLAPEDIIVDSGNSNFHDSVANAQFAKEKGIYFIDCGTSGGIKGAREGACLMVGGAPEAVKVLTPFFEDLACEQGYLYAGKSGAGHYLKMVHNGIEYVMMQAMGEGFNLLEAAEYDFASILSFRVNKDNAVVGTGISKRNASSIIHLASPFAATFPSRLANVGFSAKTSFAKPIKRASIIK